MDYQKQGTDFLENTETVFKAEFVKNGFHFYDDKEKRDIYKITLSREGRSFSCNFGQSIADSNGKTPPTPYDVLTCLQKYEVGSFEDFCGEYGYDTDSRRAEKIYNAAKEEYKNLQILYNDREVELMQKIQ